MREKEKKWFRKSVGGIFCFVFVCFRKRLMRSEVWGEEGVSVKFNATPWCSNTTAAGGAHMFTGQHPEADSHKNVLSSWIHHPPKCPRTGEGLRKGRCRHTMDYVSAVLSQVNLSSREAKEARHRRHILMLLCP